MVFLGGGLGACLRMSFSLLIGKFELPSWFGTLLANAIGCLILFIGFKYIAELNKDLNQLVKIGFLGGLTTFSTFAFEVSSAFAQGKMKEAILIFMLNMTIGIVVGIGILR